MELTGKLVNAISVDFWRPDVSAVVYVKQYDATLRVVPVYLLDNGQKYNVPSGYSANICVGKPDGTSVYNPAEVDTADASLVYVTITQQMTAATGKARCDVEIISGNDVGKTATFWLEVLPAAVSEDAIESGDEWQTVQGLVQEAQTAATNAAASAQTAQDAAEEAATDAAEAVQTQLEGLVTQAQTAAGNAATSATQAQQAAETAATEAAASAAQQAVQDVMDELEQNAVVSFNGRKGAVVPQAGDYTAADVGAYTKAETDEKISESVPNPNLLDNTNFKNPVNQRGASGTVSAAGYFIDRWKLVSGTVELTSDGIVLNGTISQVLENAAGTNVTVSASAGTPSYDDASKTFTISGENVKVSWAKLEQGSIATPWQPKGYAQELLECLRYYYRLGGGWQTLCQIVGWGSVVPIDTPVGMRASPSLVVSGENGLRIFAPSGWVGATYNHITGFAPGRPRINIVLSPAQSIDDYNGDALICEGIEALSADL